MDIELDATLFVLCLIGFVAVMPIAVYCVILAQINARDRPTLVSGSWDAAGLLIALSGFLIAGGPLLLSVIDAVWRATWLKGSFAQIREGWESANGIWIGVWAVYFVGVVGFAVWTILSRQSLTVIYNIDPFHLSEAMEDAATRVGWVCQTRHGGFVLTSIEKNRNRMIGEMDVFPRMRHASLRWTDYEPLIRAEFESALTESLRLATPESNPSSSWLLAAASCLFFLMLFCLVFMASVLFLAPA